MDAGRTIEEFLADYPYLEREDVLQALPRSLLMARSIALWIFRGVAEFKKNKRN